MTGKLTTDIFHGFLAHFVYQGPADTLRFAFFVGQNNAPVTSAPSFDVNVPATSQANFNGPYPPMNMNPLGNIGVGPADGIVIVTSLGGHGGPWNFSVPHTYDITNPGVNLVRPSNIGVRVYTGSGGVSLADFSWKRGSPNFSDEYVDISAQDGNFVTGQYLPIHTSEIAGTDPISGQPYFSVDGGGNAIMRAAVMSPNAPHWWRVSNFLNGSWIQNDPVSGITDFMSANPGTGGPPVQQISNVQISFS